ncbi:hypothetical protein KY290_006758 [Solanum tuberosum]|uniref:WD-repeat protein n=1 Tax=Solanum tuberosum TaxID=4113 RepID=A0ABQ7WJB3_SOLTU|nr:hypothetical protein KY289_029360 [Solanum tuberosum]KAH0662357.1 hypothetical protein KY284_027288 [Solanum tuberosum]KAH0721015.1 hypothetical protein KY284_006045 [Solanum tuberosum]KAH0780331.1 hypothetical protein KY290_006758 [Solanum tuberosum]
MDTPLENEEDGALKLTLPKESHDLDRDSQDLSEEFEKAATYGGNENESCIRIFKRRVEEKASLLNYVQLLTTFMPATTFSEFYLQDNNVIAIGMDDSYIQIYNVQVNEVKTKLKGHRKRITALAFSNSLNVLISTGADYQLLPWMNNFSTLTIFLLQSVEAKNETTWLI